MTTTKAIAAMLLLCSALVFSGCVEKKIYLPCKAEEPLRTATKDCEYDGNMTELAKCAAVKYTTLEGDYDILMTRFRSCK